MHSGGGREERAAALCYRLCLVAACCHKHTAGSLTSFFSPAFCWKNIVYGHLNLTRINETALQQQPLYTFFHNGTTLFAGAHWRGGGTSSLPCRGWKLAWGGAHTTTTHHTSCNTALHLSHSPLSWFDVCQQLGMDRWRQVLCLPRAGIICKPTNKHAAGSACALQHFARAARRRNAQPTAAANCANARLPLHPTCGFPHTHSCWPVWARHAANYAPGHVS